MYISVAAAYLCAGSVQIILVIDLEYGRVSVVALVGHEPVVVVFSVRVCGRNVYLARVRELSYYAVVAPVLTIGVGFHSENHSCHPDIVIVKNEQACIAAMSVGILHEEETGIVSYPCA